MPIASSSFSGQTIRQQLPAAQPQPLPATRPQQLPAAAFVPQQAAPTVAPQLDTVTWTPAILRQNFKPQDLQATGPTGGNLQFPGFAEKTFGGFSRGVPPPQGPPSPNFGEFSVFNSDLFGDSSGTSPRFTKAVNPNSGSGSGSSSFVSLFSPNFSYTSNLR